MTDGDYADVSIVQTDIISMPGDTGTTTWLDNHKPEVDRDIDNVFTRYIDLIPFVTGATEDLVSIANARLGAMWFAWQKDFDSQKYWDKQADTKTASVISRANALPAVNTRTASLVVANDPRNAKMPLPSQASIFVFDEFA